MAKQQEVGNRGEDIATKYLSDLGWSILERNWRYKKAEVDVIAKQNQCIIFVEVKTKSYAFYGNPEEQVSQRKERLLIDAAYNYMEKIKHEGEIRFDIISILMDANNQPILTHFKDAFFPGLE